MWLSQAGLIYRVFRSNKPALPLSAYDDVSAFKTYLLDVGLLRRLSQLDPVAIGEGDRLFTEFKGAMTENFVLQHLVAGFEDIPRYWSSGNKAEVDFLLQSKNKIIPVEVKSDVNIKSRSLSVFNQKFKPPLRIRYSLKNLGHRDGLLNIPLFMAGDTEKLLGFVK